MVAWQCPTLSVAQIINILIGLGLPWLLVDAFGDHNVCVTDHMTCRYCQFSVCAVGMNFILLLGLAVTTRQQSTFDKILKESCLFVDTLLCFYRIV